MSEHLKREEELHGPEEAVSFRELFGEKLIHFGSMDSLTRWLTGLGIAQIIVAVLLIGLNFLSSSAIELHRPDGTVSFTITLPVLVACVTFMTVAWTWVVVGALHSRLLLRLPVLLLFFGMHLSMLASFSSTLVTAWILLVLGLAYLVWHGLKQPGGYLRDLIVIGLGMALFYVSIIDQFQLVNPKGEFVATLLSIQFMKLSIFLLPLLMCAGLDLGESVRDVTRWFIGQGASRSSEQVLFWVAVGLNVAKLAYLFQEAVPAWGWLTAGLFLVLVGYSAVRMKPWLGVQHEPQFGILFSGAIASIFLMLVFLLVLPVFGLTVQVEHAPWLMAGVLGAVAAAGALVLALIKPGTAGRTAMLFLMIFALWSLIRSLGTPVVWNDLFGLPGSGFVDLSILDGLVTLLLPALLLYLRARGLATRSVSAWAISLTVGFTVMRVMFYLVLNNFAIPAVAAAAQLAVFGIGLLWDVLTSGDRWTNLHSDKVPRPARVMLYFGYVSMTVTALIFWKGTDQGSLFDEDGLAANGLLVLGIPLYLYGFVRAGIMLVRQEWERDQRAA